MTGILHRVRYCIANAPREPSAGSSRWFDSSRLFLCVRSLLHEVGRILRTRSYRY